MTAQPRASVVMPVHNGAAFLADAVESILAQTFQDFEFIVIDDGSTDRSPEILRRYATKDQRVLVFHRPHQGLNAALNDGCRQAQGQFIVRMDADDIAFADRLDRQISFLERHPTVAVVGGAIVIINEHRRVVTTVRYLEESKAIKRALLHHNCFAHPAVAIRRGALGAVGGYRPAFRHAEEYDLWLRLAEHHDLANLPDPVLYYRLHPDQISLCSVREQSLYTLAARAAAIRRRQGAPDPLSGSAELSAAVLRELGVQPDHAQQEGHDSFRRWAVLLVQAGRRDVADQFLRESIGNSAAPGEYQALRHQTSAKAYYRQGRLAAFAWSALQLVLAHPVTAARLVWRQAHRLFTKQ